MESAKVERQEMTGEEGVNRPGSNHIFETRYPEKIRLISELALRKKL